MLSLAELRRAAALLDARFTGYRVDRWVQPDGEQLAVRLYGRDPESEEGGKRCLLLSCAGELARIGETDRLPAAPERPPAFSSYLRAHLSRAVLRGARILDDDRQLALRFDAREGEFQLVLSIFGRRSNLYLLDSEGKIVLALRPLSETRSELALGDVYGSPGASKPPAGRDRFEEAEDDDYLRAIERLYAQRSCERERSELGSSLLQVLRRESKSARRRLEKLEAELAEADHADEYARHGELLKSVLGKIEPGASEIRVNDYESGDEVVIPLDPQKSAKANLDATFKRYQKLLRRLTKAGGQVDDARAWAQEVDGAIARVREVLDRNEDSDASDASGDGGHGDEPFDEAPLREIAERPAIRKLLSKRAAATGRPAPVEAPGSKLPARLRDLPNRLVPRRYLSKDGLEIWVGRSDEGNDYLTTRLARGNDLFFHLDGAPGSHVILRTEGRTDPPSESLLDACELAVRFSKQKNAGSASVHVVPIKQVKKPKGAKRGLVYVTGGKSIHLRRESSRLERLLNSKIE